MTHNTTHTEPLAQADGPANRRQIAGSHYKRCAIEPWDYAAANGLDPFEHAVVKYVTRWRHKGGTEDLAKARHYLDKLIELAAAGYPDTLATSYLLDQIDTDPVS